MPSGGLAVRTDDGGGVHVLHSRPFVDAVGPIPSSVGPAWIGPYQPGASLWSLVVAHARGLSADMAVAALRQVADALTDVDPALGVDAEAVWFDAHGNLVHLEPNPAVGAARGIPQLARYLLVGELAHGAEHGEDPPLVKTLERLGDDLAAMQGALSSLEADRDALGAAVFAVGPDAIDDTHPRARRTLTLGVLPVQPPGAPPRARVAKIAGLTLVLGLVSGWMLAPRTMSDARLLDLSVEGAEAFSLECRGRNFLVRPASGQVVVPGGWCTLSVRDGTDWLRADLDTTRRLKYECRVSGGELSCDDAGTP